ncbi:hypothetical protein [Streptomyces misionensis]|uniref:hypothetical protein n=1 Tax=Streptomyces misionensis TaxID=67331 RepID=UPI00396BDB98
MQNTTQPTTEQLVTLILTRAAENLRPHETITHPIGNHEIPNCMTDGWRDIEVRSATRSVLGNVRGFLRYSTQMSIEKAVWAALPPVAGTVADYADRLRETAAIQRIAA